MKAGENCDNSKLQELSKTALNQINEKNYDAEMISEGICIIYKYGVAFSGKQVAVATETRECY